MSELGHAVEAIVNLIYLIEHNAENATDAKRLTELARTPLLSLIAHAHIEDSVQRQLAR